MLTVLGSMKGVYAQLHNCFLGFEGLGSIYGGMIMVNETDYQVVISKINDDGDEYFIAYLADFGVMGCSAVGETQEEALSELKFVRDRVIKSYIEDGDRLPKPSKFVLVRERG